MSGFGFGLVSRLLKTGSSFGFSFAYAQLRFKFYLRKLFYCILNTDYLNMPYFVAFLFYYDDKYQLRWPSEESNCFRSCRFGYNSQSGEAKDSKISFHRFSILRSALKELYW